MITTMMNTLRTIKQELKNKNKLNQIDYSLINDEERKLMDQLRTDGFCVIENFYDEEKCAKLRAEIDRLIENNPDTIWKDNDGFDIRAWGTENQSDLIKEFYDNEKIHRLVMAHEGHSKEVTYTTMMGRIMSDTQNEGSGGGWHRDLPSFKQTKVILYLSDVDEFNGPFQYLLDSHKSSDIVKKQLKYGFELNQSRFSDEVLEKIIKSNPKKLVTATGKIGTLLLANTRGIHRGKPFENGTRYALTNYYWNNREMGEVFKKHSLN